MAALSPDRQQIPADTAHKRANGLSAVVLRAMSVFGGLQVVQILCSIVRVKLVAVWIGAAGVGLFGIYNSAIEMISTISQLGMRNSAVRDVVGASPSKLAVIVRVIRRWSWMLGLLGAVATLGCAPLLSRLSFDDSEHTGGFVILSIALLLTSITGGEQAVMQGTGKLRRLAVSSLWGAIGGLLLSIPMYYWWRIDSIVPSIIAYAGVGCVAAAIYRVPAGKPGSKVTLGETIEMGRGFIALGFYMTLSVFIGMLASYLFVSYLNVVADTTVVGYYQAGFTLFNRYVGLVFTSIAMEFYPRLTKVERSARRSSVYVSHEMGIVLWILLPVVCSFITLAHPIVTVLYSSEFEIIIPFISWGIVGTILRAVSWCMAFTMLARGDGRTFLLTESISAVLCITLNIGFYHFWGLTGLGISYTVWYLLYTIMVAVVYRLRYRMSVNRRAIMLAIVSMAICATTAVSSLTIGWQFPAMCSIATLAIAYRQLHHMLKR